MPRGGRDDEPGAWHHVMNRGIARRTLFETERDISTFLSYFARAVRAGRLEVHAYCVLTTHFHLLVRSPRGELSQVMQWAINQYVRWFNRGRRRDGPLLRSRFLSKRVDSFVHRCHLVRYIDFNPVEAGLVSSPVLYPHGSASWYARRRGPPWLSRDWIESVVHEGAPGERMSAETYSAVFGEPLGLGLRRLIERRENLPRNIPDPLDHLMRAAAPEVQAWMLRKSLLADGTKAGQPVCDADDLDAVVRVEADQRSDWRVATSRRSAPAWPIVRVGLLRDLCACSYLELTSRTQLSRTAAWDSHRRHRLLLAGDAEYAATSARIALGALRRTHGTGREGLPGWSPQAVEVGESRKNCSGSVRLLNRPAVPRRLRKRVVPSVEAPGKVHRLGQRVADRLSAFSAVE